MQEMAGAWQRTPAASSKLYSLWSILTIPLIRRYIIFLLHRRMGGQHLLLRERDSP